MKVLKILAVLMVIALLPVSVSADEAADSYAFGLEQMRQKQYAAASETFSALGDY